MLRQFVQDLIEAGKTEDEMTRDLETYYNLLVENCDNEMIDLREQLEIEKATFREEAADEIYLKANEIDDLSNIFLDCIHSHRKTLRNQLIRIKTDSNNNDFNQYTANETLNSIKPKLFETYLRIV